MVDYPSQSEVIPVSTTDDMLAEAVRIFPEVDGVIGAAAPCDYTPVIVSDNKIKKTGHGLTLHLEETPDVIATLGARKSDSQWVVGFALETDDQRFRAITKLESKCCDLIVLNGPSTMNSSDNNIEVIDPSGKVISSCRGNKFDVAINILQTIESALITSQ